MQRLSIPLTQLVINPAINPRSGEEDISDLTAGIRARGFADALWVRAAGDAAAATVYEVIDGSRRLRALRELAWAADVPCDVMEADDAEARELALAANIARRDLSAADEAVAFHRLLLAGVNADEIAARFGVSEKLVRQRIAIGSLPPEILAALRADEIDIADAQAFTLTHSAERQSAVFEALKAKDHLQSYNIRSALKDDKVPGHDRRAQFVGAAAYEQAGGTITRDLFDDDDDRFDGGLFDDVALLDRLFDEKLTATARALKDEGWKFVEVIKEANKAYGYGHEDPRGKRSLGDAGKTEEATLEAEARALAKERAAIENSGPEDFTAQEHERLEDIEVRLDEIEPRLAALGDKPFTAKQIAVLGALIIFDHDGVTISRGRLKPGSKAAAGLSGGASAKTEEGDDIDLAEPAPLATPSYSDAVEIILAAAARDAIKITMASAKPMLSYRMGLAARLLAFLDRNHDAPYDVSHRGSGGTAWEELRDATVHVFEPAQGDADDVMELPDFPTLLARLEALSPEDILRVEAVLAADLFLVGANLASPDVRFVLCEVDPDMGPAFTIDEEFLARLSRDQLAIIANEIAPDQKVPKGKKPDMVKAVLPLIVQSGWLPPQLRTPSYAQRPLQSGEASFASTQVGVADDTQQEAA